MPIFLVLITTDIITAALADIVSASTGNIAPCPSTDATVTLEFNANVAAASIDDALGSAVVGTDGKSVVFRRQKGKKRA